MKLYEKYLFISLIFISFIQTQDILGNYKLTGLSAVYYDFARYETPVIINDNYGQSISVIGDVYNQGDIVGYDYQGPYDESYLNIEEVQLYVNFYFNGIASIAEGSSYPASITENCASELVPIPITRDQNYSSNLNSGVTIPEIDIIGLPSKSIYAGLSSGSCSISASQVFDTFPQTATDVSIPFPINITSLSGETDTSIPGNTVLPGQTAGYVLYSNKLVSTIEHNTAIRPSLYLEWHAIDGPVSLSGLGDFIGQDEDTEDWDNDGIPGDGTDYDSIYGLKAIRVTKINSGVDCGSFNYPIAGDHIDDLQTMKQLQCIDESLDSDCTTYAENWIDDCVDKNFTTVANNDLANLYAFDLNATSSMWGGIITWNSYYEIQIDDSGDDFNSECLADGNSSDCSGRLLFSYSPQCIPSFNVRYFMAELTESCSPSIMDECGICGGDGPVTWYNDADHDGFGDPNNYKTNCLPGYCFEDESLLNYSDCLCGAGGIWDDDDSACSTGTATGHTWEWLSMGICSDENGTEYIHPITLEPLGFATCYTLSNYPGYEGATWSWDRGFSTNNLDPDDTCENIDIYHNCDGSCIDDSDGDNVCNEDDIYPDCSSNIVDCAEVCNGLSILDDCGICDSDSTNNNITCIQDCNDEWGGDAIVDVCEICNGNGCYEQDCDTYPSNEYDCNGVLSSLRVSHVENVILPLVVCTPAAVTATETGILTPLPP